MRSWPKAAPVVGKLKDMLKAKYAKAANGIGGWAYGTRDLGNGHTFHNGLDLPTSVGTPAYALWDGVVGTASADQLNGNFVVVVHAQLSPPARVSYCHLSGLGVSQGQHIRAGQVVGLTGQTGHCVGAHLHVTLKADFGAGFVDIDPMYVLRESCWM